MAIPFIDDRVKHIGVTGLRGLTAKVLRELEDVLVIQAEDEPLAVIFPYKLYLELQEALWPSALIPHASVIPELNGKTLEEATEWLRKRTQEISTDNGGANANPDFQHSMDSYAEPEFIPEGPVAVPTAPSAAFLEETQSKLDAIGQEAFEAELYQSPLPAVPPPRACAHCGAVANPSGVGDPALDKLAAQPILCPKCFMEGHRNGNCLKCAESK